LNVFSTGLSVTGGRTPPAHHTSEANNCQFAKNQLANAQTDDEVNIAVKKIRILSED